MFNFLIDVQGEQWQGRKIILCRHMKIICRQALSESLWSEFSISWHRWCSGIMQDSHSCDPGSIPGRCIIFFNNCLLLKLHCSEKDYFDFQTSVNHLNLRMAWHWLESSNSTKTTSGDCLGVCHVTIRFYLHCNQHSWPLIGWTQTVRRSYWSTHNHEMNPALWLVDYYYVLTESTERGRNFLEFRHWERQQLNL